MNRSGRLRPLWLALALTAAACSGGGDAQDQGADVDPATETTASDAAAGWNGDLRLGLAGVRSMDPAVASPAEVSEMVLADLLYDTLTELDDAGRVRPGLAVPTANADRTVWRFEIDEEATFVDGTPVTAQDVVYSIERVRGQAATSLAALALEDVTRVSTFGVAAVEITLARPSSVLPELLSSPLFGIVDSEQVEAARTQGSRAPNPSGDYALSVPAAGKLLLQRRAGTGPATITVQLFGNEGEAFDRFVAGEVHWAPIPTHRLGEGLELAGRRGVTPFQATVMLGVNAAVAPLDVPELRQALALAVDRSTLAAAAFGPAGAALNGLVPVGVPGASTACVALCGPDPEQARQLATVAFAGPQPAPLRMLIDSSEIQDAIAGVLDQQLAAAGIALDVTSLDATTVDQLISDGQQQLFLFSTLGVSRSPSVHLGPRFATGSEDNLLGYSNEFVDAAIDAATDEPVPAIRARLWRDLEAAILTDIPLIPLVQLQTVAALSPDITGLVIRVDGSIDVSGVRPAQPAG